MTDALLLVALGLFAVAGSILAAAWVWNMGGGHRGLTEDDCADNGRPYVDRLLIMTSDGHDGAEDTNT